MTVDGNPYEGADPRLAWMLRVLSDEFGMLGVLRTQQAAFDYVSTQGRIDHRLGPEDDEATEQLLHMGHGVRADDLSVTVSGPGVKMLRETLCLAQMRFVDSDHVRRLQALIDACDRARPLGTNGKHGDRHTPDCGCEDAPPTFEPMTEEAKREYQEALTRDWDSLETAVHQAVGAASSCWEHLEGAGVFDDTRAVLVARSLIEWIERHDFASARIEDSLREDVERLTAEQARNADLRTVRDEQAARIRALEADNAALRTRLGDWLDGGGATRGSGEESDHERPGPDPRAWAEEFVVRFYNHPVGSAEVNEETMISWFTDAIEAGRNRGAATAHPVPPQEADARAEIERLTKDRDQWEARAEAAWKRGDKDGMDIIELHGRIQDLKADNAALRERLGAVTPEHQVHITDTDAGSVAPQPEESDGDMMGRMGTDAVKWAEEFKASRLRTTTVVTAPDSVTAQQVADLLHNVLDDATLTTWFACAIGAGEAKNGVALDYLRYLAGEDYREKATEWFENYYGTENFQPVGPDGLIGQWGDRLRDLTAERAVLSSSLTVANERVAHLMRRTTQVQEAYRALKDALAHPPEGWYPMGLHAEDAVGLQFWGADESGTPLWERPVPSVPEATASVGSVYTDFGRARSEEEQRLWRRMDADPDEWARQFARLAEQTYNEGGSTLLLGDLPDWARGWFRAAMLAQARRSARGAS